MHFEKDDYGLTKLDYQTEIPLWGNLVGGFEALNGVALVALGIFESCKNLTQKEVKLDSKVKEGFVQIGKGLMASIPILGTFMIHAHNMDILTTTIANKAIDIFNQKDKSLQQHERDLNKQDLEEFSKFLENAPPIGCFLKDQSVKDKAILIASNRFANTEHYVSACRLADLNEQYRTTDIKRIYFKAHEHDIDTGRNESSAIREEFKDIFKK